MSTMLPTAWPSPDPPWISLIAMFVTLMFSLGATSWNLRHAPGVSTCTPGCRPTGTSRSWHAAQNGSYTEWLSGSSST